jgi:hypothetical protein
MESSDRAIHGSAESAAFVFASLMDLNDKSVADHKAVLNRIGDGKIEVGTLMEKQAELSASYDHTWKLLLPAAILGTYAIVEKDATTGLMSRLALTAVQRDEILRKLRETFGDQVTHGLQVGQISVVAAAAALYEVIGNQKRPPRQK